MSNSLLVIQRSFLFCIVFVEFIHYLNENILRHFAADAYVVLLEC